MQSKAELVPRPALLQSLPALALLQILPLWPHCASLQRQHICHIRRAIPARGREGCGQTLDSRSRAYVDWGKDDKACGGGSSLQTRDFHQQLELVSAFEPILNVAVTRSQFQCQPICTTVVASISVQRGEAGRPVTGTATSTSTSSSTLTGTSTGTSSTTV